MGAQTGIEWTDATWTPIRAINRDTGKVGWHCEHVTEACRNCYAERINKRLGTGLEFRRQDREAVEIILDENMLTAPLRWRKPRKIFVCSMTDLFADFVTDAMIDRMFAVMALAPQHIFQVLTKRPDRMRAYLLNPWSRVNIGDCAGNLVEDGDNAQDYVVNRPWPLSNIWDGVSVHDQPSADDFIPLLLDTPAAKRFISYEPVLGPLSLRWMARFPYTAQLAAGNAVNEYDGARRLDWVIAGGESGPGARPPHPDWFRSVRDQCAAAGVPFHFKQWGEWAPWEEDHKWRPDRGCALTRDGRAFADAREIDRAPADTVFHLMQRVGKARAGRLLDGVTHDEFPS